MPRLRLSDKTPEYKVQYWIECLLRDRKAYGPYEFKRRVGMQIGRAHV